MVLLPTVREETEPAPGRGHVPGGDGQVSGQAPGWFAVWMGWGDHRGLGAAENAAYPPSIEKYTTVVYMCPHTKSTKIYVRICALFHLDIYVRIWYYNTRAREHRQSFISLTPRLRIRVERYEERPRRGFPLKSWALI